MRAMLIVLGCLALTMSMTGRAAGDVFESTIPPDTLAWWRLDPSGFAANRADPAHRAQRDLVVSGLRAAVASGVIQDEGAARALQGLLAASEVGGRPHTLCLLKLDAERGPDGSGMAPRVFQMVLELETPNHHASLLRTVRAILIGNPDEPRGAQRQITLPGGVAGVAYRESDWAPWREISWASTEDSFIIGLGRGALNTWFEEQAGVSPDKGRWSEHEAWAQSSRVAGAFFFQAFMNLDGIRHAFPEAFHEGRTQRVLEAVDLSNAREFMLHGGWVSAEDSGAGLPMIAADITWSARSERPEVIRGRAISESTWPFQLTMPKPNGSYVVVIRAPWDQWVYTALELVPAASRTTSTARRAVLIRRWLRTSDIELRQFLSMLQPWLVLSDAPTPVTPMPGATTLFAPLKRGVTAREASDALLAVLEAQEDRISIDDGVWWFQVDPAGVLRIPAWGFVGPKESPIMVGGWGPPVVTENRKTLGDPLK